MYNMLLRVLAILTFSLLLASCSEEQEKPVDKNEESKTEITKNKEVTSEEGNAQQELGNGQQDIQTGEMQQQENQTSSNESEDGSKWDKIVDPKAGSNNLPESSQDKPEYNPTFAINENDVVLGNKNSKVVLMEYYSPTCPHCAQYHKTIFLELKKKYIDTNKIAYVIREFIGSKLDLDAAVLQRCENIPENIGRFLKFQDIILEQQDKWSSNNNYKEMLTAIGQVGGITPEMYEKCLNDDKIIKVLGANSILASRSPNFKGTPAFFINGNPINGGYSLVNISQLLDKALNDNNTPSN